MSLTLHTSRFGTIEYEEESIISFKEGLLGFAEAKRFLLLDHKAAAPEFKWLQAVEKPDLSFVLIAPSSFRDNYKVTLSKEDAEVFGDNYEVWTTVTVPEDPVQITANLKGPLVINRQKGIGKQLVLDNKKYTTAHYILAELMSKMEAAKASAKKAVAE